MTRYGLVDYNHSFTLEELVRFAAETGFGYIEIPVTRVWDEADEEALRGKVQELDRLLGETGLTVSALAARNDFLQPDEEGVQRQARRLERVGEIAVALGCRILRVDGGWAKPGVPQEFWYERIVSGLRAIRPYLEEKGLYAALDNHGLVTNDADFQRRILDAVGSSHVGANLDTMNYRWAGHDLDTVRRFYRVIAPYTLHVHVKDGVGSRDHYRGTVLGEGEIPLDEALEILDRAGYRGVLAVEYEGDRAAAAEGFRRGLAWLRQHAGAGPTSQREQE